MSDSGIEPLVFEETPQLTKFFWYDRPGQDAADRHTVAEPSPPETGEGSESPGPHQQLARCLSLLAKTLSRVEGEKLSGTQLVSALEQVVQQARELGRDIRTLQNDIESLEAERDLLTVALRRAEALSLADELTGLPNRRAFLQRLDQEISRGLRTGQPLTVALLDLDNFKQINDRFGHHVGDRVLHSFAQRVVRELRQHDLSARYGGEEFVLLFPVSRQDEARNALEKLRRQASLEVLDVDGLEVELPTFSAGVAGFRAGDSSTALINRADHALYRAKRLGRDRTESDEPPPERPAP